MKGATIEPCEKIIMAPKVTSIIIIGNNQNFFLIFINLINSIKKLI